MLSGVVGEESDWVVFENELSEPSNLSSRPLVYRTHSPKKRYVHQSGKKFQPTKIPLKLETRSRQTFVHEFCAELINRAVRSVFCQFGRAWSEKIGRN